MNKNIISTGSIIFAGFIVIALGVFIIWFQGKQVSAPNISDVPSSQSPDGGNRSITNLNITIDNLTEGQQVTLPMTVTGVVKVWFFEGSFPVFLKDSQGNQLAVALASSPVDWMTADPIPFTVTLPSVTYTGPGTITFQKDNPSGEPQFDEELVVNVIF